MAPVAQRPFMLCLLLQSNVLVADLVVALVDALVVVRVVVFVDL